MSARQKVESPPNLIIGNLNREFVLPLFGQPYIDKLGGNLAYATGGYAIWDKGVGLVSAVGEDFPQNWLYQIEKLGFDIRGIFIRPESMELRKFYAYSENHKSEAENPLAHFSQRQLTFPRTLLGYRSLDSLTDSHINPDPNTIKSKEIPCDYLEASRALICPLDFISQSLIANTLRQGKVKTLIIATRNSYMNSSFFNDVPSLFRIASIVLTQESEIRNLFIGHSNDLWEMAENIALMGCDSIIIFREEQGLLVYERANSKRWLLPSYPSLVADPTGVFESFAGGFFYGYQKTYKPEESALFGTISASLTVEGSGPLYPLDSLSGLANARLQSLRQVMTKV